tara:strand:- start:2048 stop:3091 length:1044 start_codon:yes stop_codon:yes gene_type:complete
VKYKTVAYKGSKRKLLENIEQFAKEIEAKTFFDGFSGTGIVSAHMRHKQYEVSANDMNYSSYVYGNVFLKGYNPEVVSQVLECINNVDPLEGWLTQNYSGEKERVIKGTNGSVQSRPLGYTRENAMKIDAAREYIETISLSEEDKNALIFSIILGADKVFNNSNDQKSSLKEWSKNSKKPVKFVAPTLIAGPVGKQYMGDIQGLKMPKSDVVYLDPPYSHGVLYSACYHLNDSIAKWTKPELDHSYAVPRPKEVCFRKNKQTAGGFYSNKTAVDAFDSLIAGSECKRLILSYSDAPRNTLTIEELCGISSKYGKVELYSEEHKICMQPNSLKKISETLKEFFIVLDK